jgi:hypothetical protein
VRLCRRLRFACHNSEQLRLILDNILLPGMSIQWRGGLSLCECGCEVGRLNANSRHTLAKILPMLSSYPFSQAQLVMYQWNSFRHDDIANLSHVHETDQPMNPLPNGLVRGEMAGYCWNRTEKDRRMYRGYLHV